MTKREPSRWLAQFHADVRDILTSTLPTGERMLLMAYRLHVNGKTGTAWPGSKALEEHTGMSRASIIRARRSLIKSGALVVDDAPAGKVLVVRVDLSGLPDPAHCDTGITVTPVSERAPTLLTVTHPPAQGDTGTLLTVTHEQERENRDEENRDEEQDPPKGSDLWDEINSRLVAQGKRKLKLTTARRRALNARVKEHSREDVLLVIDWWLTSSHDRADYIRKHHTIDTLFRASKFDAYVELASIVEMTEEEKFMQTYARLESEAETTPTERDHR